MDRRPVRAGRWSSVVDATFYNLLRRQLAPAVCREGARGVVLQAGMLASPRTGSGLARDMDKPGAKLNRGPHDLARDFDIGCLELSRRRRASSTGRMNDHLGARGGPDQIGSDVLCGDQLDAVGCGISVRSEEH